MDDLKALSGTGLEAGELGLEDFARAIYLDGVRDAMAYLGHVLEQEGEA